MTDHAKIQNYELADWMTSQCQTYFEKTKEWIVKHPAGTDYGVNRYVIGERKSTNIHFDFLKILQLPKQISQSSDDEIHAALADFNVNNPQCFSYIT